MRRGCERERGKWTREKEKLVMGDERGEQSRRVELEGCRQYGEGSSGDEKMGRELEGKVVNAGRL